MDTVNPSLKIFHHHEEETGKVKSFATGNKSGVLVAWYGRDGR